jgi:cytoskeletal protein RodZ
MSDVNNQDQEYFRRLQDFREEPPADLRAKIHEQIGEKKKKRRVLFWWLNAGPELYFRAAAVLAGVALLSYFVFSNWKEENNRVLTSVDSMSSVSIDTSSPQRVDRDDDIVSSANESASNVSSADDSLSSAPVKSTPRREKRINVCGKQNQKR